MKVLEVYIEGCIIRGNNPIGVHAAALETYRGRLGNRVLRAKWTATARVIADMMRRYPKGRR